MMDSMDLQFPGRRRLIHPSFSFKPGAIRNRISTLEDSHKIRDEVSLWPMAKQEQLIIESHQFQPFSLLIRMTYLDFNKIPGKTIFNEKARTLDSI